MLARAVVLLLAATAAPAVAGCPRACRCDRAAVACRRTPPPSPDGFPAEARAFVLREAAAVDPGAVFAALPPAIDRAEFYDCGFVGTDEGKTWSHRIGSLKVERCANATSAARSANASNLRDLDLSGNGIAVLGSCFRTLGGLRVLNLSANRLDSMVEKSFSGLENLRSLDLSGNLLKKLSDKVFQPLGNLRYLNISRNKLEVLDEAWFGSLVRLQQLDVSWNFLKEVSPGNSELPSLTRLFLSGNPTLGNSKKPTLLVGIGSRLQTVDASNTGLQKVPSSLTRSIRTLKLSQNSIHTINCGDFDYFPLLQILDFAQNNLKIIEDDALGRLDLLTILYLHENNLIGIPKSLPEKLEVLHLNKNRIRIVRSNDLQGLRNLELLNLADNNLTKIEDDSFDHLLSLSSLDLSGNPLSVPAGLLTVPGKLQSLKLSAIASLVPAKDAAFPLTTPEYLIVLDLSKSPGLARQLLADTAALAASRELQELDLSNSGLENIRSDLLHYLPQLRMLKLKGNPLNCSDLFWLGLWMRRQGIDENREVTCVYPPEFWGVRLVDLTGLENEDETTIKPNEFLGITDRDFYHFTDGFEITNTTVQVSHYYGEKIDESSIAHPGMLILVLILGVLLTGAILAIITAKFNKRKLNQNLHDIEVSSIPNVTELW